MDKLLVRVKANVIKMLKGFNIIVNMKSYINKLTETLIKIINVTVPKKKA